MKYAISAEAESPHGPGETLHYVSDGLREAGHGITIGTVRVSAARLSAAEVRDVLAQYVDDSEPAQTETVLSIARHLGLSLGEEKPARSHGYNEGRARCPNEYNHAEEN